MAPPPPTSYLTAAGSLAVAVTAATFTVDGPWEPISMMLGWLVPMLLAIGLVLGRPGGVAAAAATYVVRIGVHGIAGDRTPGLAVSALLLVAMIELAAVSWDSRRMPIPLDGALARTVLLAAGAGLAVGLVAVGEPRALGSGAAPAVIGLMGAMAVTAILLRLGKTWGRR